MISIVLLSFLFGFEALSACDASSCTSLLKKYEKELKGKNSRFSKCDKDAKACGKSCSRQKELEALDRGTGNGMSGNYSLAMSSFSTTKNKAKGIHDQCSKDHKAVTSSDKKKPGSCKGLVDQMQKDLNACKAQKKIAGSCAKFDQPIAKLESLLKGPSDKKDGCGALAGAMLPQSQGVMDEMAKMMSALAPALAALGNGSPKGESQKPGEMSCEEKVEEQRKKLSKKDFECTKGDDSCCERFPCAKGCAKLVTRLGKTTQVEAAVRGPTNTERGRSKLSTVETANQVDDPDKAALEAALNGKNPPIDCSRSVNRLAVECTGGYQQESQKLHASNSTPPAVNSKLKGSGEESYEVDDPETGDKKDERKSTVPAPTFENVSTSWQGSGYSDDGETGGYESGYSQKIAGGSNEDPARKQIAPKEGKNPFEIISGAYDRARNKGFLLNQ